MGLSETRLGRRDGWRLSAVEVLALLSCLLLAIAFAALEPWAATIPLALFISIVGLQAPKLLLSLCIVGVVFSNAVQLYLGQIGTYVDEVLPFVALLAAVLWRIRSRQFLRAFPGFVPLLIFVVLGIASALAQGVEITIWSAQVLLVFKGVALGLAVAQFDWDAYDLRFVAPGIAALAVVLIAAGVLHFMLRDSWGMLIGLPPVSYRYGLPAITGLFRHPSDYAIVMAAICVAVSAYRLAINKSPLTWFLMMATAAASLLTWRRRTIVGAVSALVMLQVRARRVAPIAGIVLIVPIVLVVIWSDLSDAVDETLTEYVVRGAVSARSVITAGAFDVANQYLPLGAGFGRYGSYLAAEYYSPEYSSRGFQSIWGLSASASGNGRWLTDTQWPAILGEAGYFGAAAYVVALISIGVAAWKSSSGAQNPVRRLFGFVGMGWLMIALIDSTAAPTFYSAPGFVILFVAAGMNVAGPNARSLGLQRWSVGSRSRRLDKRERPGQLAGRSLGSHSETA